MAHHQADGQVLLIVDMLSDYAFRDAEEVQPSAAAAVPNVLRARDAADVAGVPVVYANDLHGDWRSSRAALIDRALGGRRPDLVEPIVPRDDDVLFFKGQYSAFYGTALAHYLYEGRVGGVVLAGQVTEQCILYTALDAYARDYAVTVLRDAIAHLDDGLGRAALAMMERNMSATVLDAAGWSP